MVLSRSSSSAEPVRTNLRRRRSAVPPLHPAEIAVAVLPDTDAFGVIAISADRRGAAGADPFAAALVSLLLLGEALAQGFHQLVPAERGELLLFLLGEVLLGELLQPFLWNIDLLDRIDKALQPLEGDAEHPVELVEITFVLHQCGA